MFRDVLLLAPTGKAARRIHQVIKKDFKERLQQGDIDVRSSTVHSLLGIGLPIGAKQAVQFILPENALVVIDEASMLDLDMAFEIVEVAKRPN